jgi:hypothetical protein
MRTVIILAVLLLQLTIVSTSAHAADYTNSLLFKVMIKHNGEETEFEYENPAHYEWEAGTKVIKGEEAKNKVEQIFDALNVSSRPNVEQLKSVLEKNGYPKLEKFVVRWIDPKGNLYTWHWDKEVEEALAN